MILNSLIFNEIIPYIIYKNKKFKRLLELSLISKQTFKIIQNLITNESKLLKIIIGSISSFKLYISISLIYNLIIPPSDGHHHYYSYNNKLIQYKDIEYLNCIGSYDNNNNNNNDLIIKSNKMYKEYFNSNCLKLKRIHLIMNIKKSKINQQQQQQGVNMMNDYDFTMNGFFSFKKLFIDINNLNLPISNFKEYKICEYIGADALKSTNLFSFQFIKYYNPEKLVIKDLIGIVFDNIFKDYNDGDGSSSGDDLSYFKNIKSLEYITNSIDSSFLRFIQVALKSKYLKTLKVCKMKYDGDGNDDDQSVLKKELANIINIGLSNNNNKFLNKLNLNLSYDDDDFNNLIIPPKNQQIKVIIN